jgi:hypothetical protein
MNPANLKLVQGQVSFSNDHRTGWHYCKLGEKWSGEGGFYASKDLDDPWEKDHPFFGSLDGQERASLDLCCNFCVDHQTYLLYLWHILDGHQLWNLNALPNDLADGGEYVQRVISNSGASAKKGHGYSAYWRELKQRLVNQHQ